MIKKSKGLLVLMIIILCFCSLSVYGSDSFSDKKPVEFTLAFSTWVGYGPFFIAEKMNYFKKYGIEPRLTIIDDESQFSAALASNAIQSLAHVLDREVIAAANDVEEKVVLALDQSSGGDGIIASGEIQKPADLVGKTVALDKSSTSYFFFLTVLKKNGISESDMTIRDMGADAAGTSFLEGDVDAAVTWEPWLTNAGAREGGHLLVSSADYPGTIVDVVCFNQKFVDDYPEAISGLSRAWYDAVEYYKENPDKGNEMMADGLDISVGDVASMITGVKFYDREENAELFDKSQKGNLYDVADRALEFWYELGIINKKIDAEKLVTSDFLN